MGEQVDERVQFVINLIQFGLKGADLLKRVQTDLRLNLYGADALIKEAYAVTKRDMVKVSGLTDHLATRQELLEQAKQAGNLDASLKILKDMADLQKTYEEKVDKTLEIEFLFPDLQGYRPLDRTILEAALKQSHNKKEVISDVKQDRLTSGTESVPVKGSGGRSGADDVATAQKAGGADAIRGEISGEENGEGGV